jgi:hypothetical protein
MTTHIEDCLIDGGSAFDTGCPVEDPCEGDPTGEATIWNPRNILGLSPETKTITERFAAVEGQVLFQLHDFTYIPGTGALDVHKNGLLLTPGRDWVEQSNSQFQVVVPCVAGDILVAQGWVGITGIVDVRDTDIYVDNYQEIRDYTGTEVLLYALGEVTRADGGQGFFIFVIGAPLGFYVDNNYDVLVPTGGDGTRAWVRKVQEIYGILDNLITTGSVVVGDIVETRGYYVEGDSGGNVYEIVPAGTGTPDFGHYIDLTTSGLQAKGLFGAAPADYNTMQWGALGDGVSDDTTRIQNAIDFLAVSGGGTMTFPLSQYGGVYRCNIIITDNTSLIGFSRNVQLIPAIDAPVITLNTIDPINRVGIRTLVINGLATKNIFTNQDGILINPQGSIIQDKIFITNCIITDCGRTGINVNVDEVDAEVRELVISRSTIRDCIGSGIYIEGDAAQTIIRSCAINNNGDENIDTKSNVSINGGSINFKFPEDLSIDSCRIENDNYLVSGVSVAIQNVLGMTITNCGFTNFFTAIKLFNGVNGQVLVQDCRFERDDAVDIESLVELVAVNGFTWTNNNVAAGVTGPEGIKYSGPVTSMLKLDIESNNSWGNLTQSAGNFPPTILNGTIVWLPSRNGTVPISLASDGTAALNDILDEKGGTAQLVAGDEVILHITDPARQVNVTNSPTVKLAGGATFAMNTVSDIIKLSWSSYSQAWIEISRSDNAA